jgi:protein-tyrosine phosphatase
MTFACVYSNIYVATFAEIEQNHEQLANLDVKQLLVLEHNTSVEHMLKKFYSVDVACIPIESSSTDWKTNIPKVIRFISRSLMKEETLVICTEESGIDRSVFAIMSYLVARQHLSVTESFQLIKEKLDSAIEQLDESYIQFLNEYSTTTTTTPSSSHELPLQQKTEKSSVDIARELRESIQQEAENSTNDQRVIETVFCKACRQELVTANDLVVHNTQGRGKKSFSFKKLKKDARSAQTALNKDCNAYFVEKKAWMGPLDTDSGDLSCPKCNKRVGCFKWSGLQCSCGVWVTPAIQILKSRADVSYSDLSSTV